MEVKTPNELEYFLGCSAIVITNPETENVWFLCLEKEHLDLKLFNWAKKFPAIMKEKWREIHDKVEKFTKKHTLLADWKNSFAWMSTLKRGAQILPHQ